MLVDGCVVSQPLRYFILLPHALKLIAYRNNSSQRFSLIFIVIHIHAFIICAWARVKSKWEFSLFDVVVYTDMMECHPGALYDWFFYCSRIRDEGKCWRTQYSNKWKRFYIYTCKMYWRQFNCMYCIYCI